MKNSRTIKSTRERIQAGGWQAFCVLFSCMGALLLVGMGSRPPQMGGPAPDFTLESFEGRRVSLSEFRGKVVLVNFWASWCEPCKKEMPEIEAAYQRHKNDGLVVLAVNFGERKEEAERHVRGLSFPLLLDRNTVVAEAYGIRSLPVTFFIDSDGIIRERMTGGLLTKEGIEQTFQTLRSRP